MLNAAVEMCGWVGGLILIFAYAMVSMGNIAPRGQVFQWLNIAGSVMVGANSGWHHAWPSVTINLVWVVVGISALVHRLRLNVLQPVSHLNEHETALRSGKRVAAREPKPGIEK